MFHLFSTQNVNFQWLTYVKGFFDECGLTCIWNCQNFINERWTKEKINQCLWDQLKRNWNDDRQTCSKTSNHRILKDSFGFEDYFNILDEKYLFAFCKFRTVNHRPPIECGRWQNLERENRKCNLCNSHIGDEFHYILRCSFFENERKTYMKKNVHRRPNILYFKEIISSKNKQNLLINRMFV